MTLTARIFLLCTVCTSALLASDSFSGTWKFSPRKSKVHNPSNFVNRMRIIDAIGPNTYRLTETFDGPDGNQQKQVSTLVFDGKQHTWPNGTLAVHERPDDKHVRGHLERNGHVETIEVVISDDGRMQTLHVKGNGLNTGEAVDEMEVFDRQ
jgi:hypothetical protein